MRNNALPYNPRLTFAVLLFSLLLSSLSTADPGRAWPKAKFPHTVVKVGQGTPVDRQAAVTVKLKSWSDKFDGQPVKNGPTTRVVTLSGYSKLAGLRPLLKGMRVGGVRRTIITPRGLANKPPMAVYPEKPMFLELEVSGVHPPKAPQWLTVKGGHGQRTTREWDRILVRCQGWTGGFDGTKFYSSPPGKPLSCVLTPERIASGWFEGLTGVKVGETRRLELPYYLASGCPNFEKLKPLEPVFFEFEIVDIVD